MHRFLLAGAILLSFTASVAAQEPPKVTTLMSRDLTDIPGKEGTMLTWSMRLAERTPSIATTRMHSCTCWKAPSSCRSRGRSQSPFTLVRPSMKVRTMFTLSVATPARRSRRSSWCSSSRTRAHQFSCRWRNRGPQRNARKCNLSTHSKIRRSNIAIRPIACTRLRTS